MARLLGNLWHWHRAKPPLVRLLHYALAVVLLGPPAGYLLSIPFDTSCATGVERRGGDSECTGVTDGSYPFFDELEPVSDRIKDENDRVEDGDTAYATIALMIPLPHENNDVEKERALREVQGAYLAQWRANHVDKDSPPIRLVLANPGHDNKRGKEVADQLADMASGGERLRGVFGFNRSVDSTLDTITYLTQTKGIPVVGGPITSEGIDPGNLPGLAKVIPPDRDQAEALTRYLDVTPQETFLVEDIKSDDLYAKSVREAFRAETTESKGAKTPYAPEQFDSSNVLPNDFKQMVNNLCDSQATTVYFSGRVPELAQFIRALGNRGCTHHHYTVVTLSGGSLLALDPVLQSSWQGFKRGAGIDVKYATVTHEDAWTTNVPPSTGGSAEDFHALSDFITDPKEHEKVGDMGRTDLADGHTITTHDAALTMIEGIRNRQVAGDRIPDLADVREAWRRLHGDSKVRGASGWICLDNDGNAFNKAVAIVRLDPDPPHITFEKLAWPTGEPPTDECKAQVG
ncbi:hypothetical protein [Streptomyces sp. 8N616]|uniref:hypothetical protein n=1 Tax=Streptomyces sp. 8N616 TaxID=3457414 RepID=UPI003FCF8416